ncbi:MAG: hypothetical protein L6416_09820 [Candidatus Omnitrophica bacterium]|nr:hypothetical protein [Candidatus Omnitrophota bacterium]
MFEILGKIVLAGVGLANLTKEKAEKLVDALIKKGQIQAEDKKAVLSRLLQGTKKLDKDLEKKMKQISAGILDQSQKQINALNNKLTKIAKALEAGKSKNVDPKTKKKAKTKKK